MARSPRTPKTDVAARKARAIAVAEARALQAARVGSEKLPTGSGVAFVGGLRQYQESGRRTTKAAEMAKRPR